MGDTAAIAGMREEAGATRRAAIGTTAKDAKARGRYPRRLHRAREEFRVDAELVMSCQRTLPIPLLSILWPLRPVTVPDTPSLCELASQAFQKLDKFCLLRAC